MTARRDNNGNADDADWADRRGFAARDVRRDNNGNADDADFADRRGFARQDYAGTGFLQNIVGKLCRKC